MLGTATSSLIDADLQSIEKQERNLSLLTLLMPLLLVLKIVEVSRGGHTDGILATAWLGTLRRLDDPTFWFVGALPLAAVSLTSAHRRLLAVAGVPERPDKSMLPRFLAVHWSASLSALLYLAAVWFTSGTFFFHDRSDDVVVRVQRLEGSVVLASILASSYFMGAGLWLRALIIRCLSDKHLRQPELDALHNALQVLRAAPIRLVGFAIAAAALAAVALLIAGRLTASQALSSLASLSVVFVSFGLPLVWLSIRSRVGIPPVPTAASRPTPRQIQGRAYALYLARRNANAVTDWLQAERELS